MKKINLIITAIFFYAILLTACNNATIEQTKDATDSTVTQQRAEMYECPMKCEGKKFDKPGKCPICDMDLVKIEK